MRSVLVALIVVGRFPNCAQHLLAAAEIFLMAWQNRDSMPFVSWPFFGHQFDLLLAAAADFFKYRKATFPNF